MMRFAGISCVSLMGLVLSEAKGQATERPYPRFPDGISSFPAEVTAGAPFDARGFEAPPYDQNAAPLYLDALLEFGAETSSCFAPGAERDRRRVLALQRSKEFSRVYEIFQIDHNAVPHDELAKLVKEYDEGFKKVALAQKRDRCVFETGVGPSSVLPHAQVARTVARVASMRVHLALAEGKIDAAIEDVKMLLRLDRDLRPRGFIITQLVSSAILNLVCKEMILPILDSPTLRAEQCDAILDILADHQAKALEMYAEGLKMEYLSKRFTIIELVRNQEAFARELDIKPGMLIKTVIGSSNGMALAAGPVGVAPEDLPKPEPVPDDADARVARMTPAEIDKIVKRLNEYFRVLLSLKDRPRIELAELVPDPAGFLLDDDLLSRAIRASNAPIGPFTKSFGRAEADCAGLECLTAVRRWQLTHNGNPPPDLAAAFQPPLKRAVPTDPFDRQPMRLILQEGRPVVYSIGKDGEDALGLVDSDNDRLTGDLVYSLPAPQK